MDVRNLNWVYNSFTTKRTKLMDTDLGHWLRANKSPSRLGLPVARFKNLDNLIHPDKVGMATNSESANWQIRLKMQNCRTPALAK